MPQFPRDLLTHRLDDDTKLILDTVQALAEKQLLPGAAKWNRQGFVDPEVFAQLAELGLFGACFPGDSHQPMRTRYLVGMMLSWVDTGLAVGFGVHCELGGPAFVALANKTQMGEFGHDFATGRKRLCFGLTEPPAGSNPKMMRTTAVPDGEHYEVNGEKCFISNANEAAYAVVFMKIGSADGPMGCFLVPLREGAPGLTVGTPIEKIGLNASPTCSISFSDYRIHRDFMLGEPGQAWEIAKLALRGGRIGVCGQGVGGGFRALSIAESLACQRVLDAKGGTVSNRQNTEVTLARHVRALVGAELLGYQAAELYDTREPTDPFVDAFISMAKVSGSEAGFQAADAAMQIMGGNGYSKEYEVSTIWANLRVTRIYEGANEVHEWGIGRGLTPLFASTGS